MAASRHSHPEEDRDRRENVKDYRGEEDDQGDGYHEFGKRRDRKQGNRSRSIDHPCFVALHPRATPRKLPIAPAKTRSAAELSSRGPTCPHTDVPLARELPRWPVTSPESQSQYCSNAGRFKWSAAQGRARLQAWRHGQESPRSVSGQDVSSKEDENRHQK